MRKKEEMRRKRKGERRRRGRKKKIRRKKKRRSEKTCILLSVQFKSEEVQQDQQPEWCNGKEAPIPLVDDLPCRYQQLTRRGRCGFRSNLGCLFRIVVGASSGSSRSRSLQ